MQIPSIDQLKRALHLTETIESLQKEMAAILGTAGAKVLGVVESGLKMTTRGIRSINVKGKRKRRMSKAARAKIAAAQRLRWAKAKGKKVVAKTKRKKGKMSAAGRAAIVAAQKKRWAKVRKAKASGA